METTRPCLVHGLKLMLGAFLEAFASDLRARVNAHNVLVF